MCIRTYHSHSDFIVLFMFLIPPPLNPPLPSFAADLGLPGLGVGQTMAVTIQPSDDAFGRFSFSTDTLSHIIPEQVGGVPVTFTVLRDGGTFGVVSVYWRVTQTGGSTEVTDVSPASGQVVFQETERQQQFTLTVEDDTVRILNQVTKLLNNIYSCRLLS